MNELIRFSTLSLQLYDQKKDEPPLGRNMPPVALKIDWVRHLYKKIEEPIAYIKVRLHLSHQNNIKFLIVLYSIGFMLVNY